MHGREGLLMRLITFTRTPHRQPPMGLGDAIAKATSAVGIKPCGGCKQRQAALNKAMPNINPFHNPNQETKHHG